MTSDPSSAQQADVDRFYELLQSRTNAIRSHYGRIPTPRDLAAAHADRNARGVYFFFEPSEKRVNHNEQRIVRIGSLTGEKSSIQSRVVGAHAKDWGRSVFRNHLGSALIRQGKFDHAIAPADREKWAQHWSSKDESDTVHNYPKKLDRTLHSLHPVVTRAIESMTLVWVEIADKDEGLELEKQCIRLLSNYLRQRAPIDPSSHSWLGRYALDEKIRTSGLWNVKHVDKPHSPSFLTEFRKYFVRGN